VGSFRVGHAGDLKRVSDMAGQSVVEKQILIIDAEREVSLIHGGPPRYAITPWLNKVNVCLSRCYSERVHGLICFRGQVCITYCVKLSNSKHLGIAE